MRFENINLWFAKDIDGRIITIDKINENNKHEKYTCPICGSEVIPKTGEIMSWHFAHKNANECSNEAQIHFWIKNELLKRGDNFNVKIDNGIKEFVCKEILIEQQYKTSVGIYNPDITIITKDDKTIYFEVANTNKKKINEYLDIWLELNNIVVEVETKDLINGNDIKEFKSINYKKYKFDKDINKDVKKSCKKNKIGYKYFVENLQWLMNDCYKYLNNEIEIEELFKEIELLDNRYIFLNIIRDNKCCNNIYNDLKKYESKECEKELLKLESEYNGNIKIQYDGKIKILSNLYNEIYNMDNKWEQIYSSTGFTLWSLNKCKNYIDNHITEIENIKKRNYILNSKEFNNVIKNINIYIKTLDDKYSLEREVQDYEINNCYPRPCNWEKEIEYKLLYNDKTLKPIIDTYKSQKYCIHINIDIPNENITYDYLYNSFFEQINKNREEYRYWRTLQSNKEICYISKSEYECIKYIINKLYDNFEKVADIKADNNHDNKVELDIHVFTEGFIRLSIRNTDVYTDFYHNTVEIGSWRNEEVIFNKINANNKELIYKKINYIYSNIIRKIRYKDVYR
ncbi:competence protein CoiA family protein [Clostridium sp. VAP52]|uniref:competence protein CoiA family protein n=1 Tax=Clostridium sp. VAP52 TaxID=2949977 RepID=UPI00207973D5|nr:competence protein CoiA family protein [Clostridium sp. VAP52]